MYRGMNLKSEPTDAQGPRGCEMVIRSTPPHCRPLVLPHGFQLVGGSIPIPKKLLFLQIANRLINTSEVI